MPHHEHGVKLLLHGGLEQRIRPRVWRLDVTIDLREELQEGQDEQAQGVLTQGRRGRELARHGPLKLPPHPAIDEGILVGKVVVEEGDR